MKSEESVGDITGAGGKSSICVRASCTADFSPNSRSSPRCQTSCVHFTLAEVWVNDVRMFFNCVYPFLTLIQETEAWDLSLSLEPFVVSALYKVRTCLIGDSLFLTLVGRFEQGDVHSACPHVVKDRCLQDSTLFFVWRSTAGAGLVLNELNGSPRLSVARAGDVSPRLCGRAYLRGCEAIVKIGAKLGWTYVFF